MRSRTPAETSERALLGELALAWESMEAAQQLAAALARPAGATLEPLLERLRRTRPGLRVALYRVRGERLHLAACAGTGPLAAERGYGGLAALALGRGEGVLRNDIATAVDLEPELARAACAYASAAVSGGVQALLLAWREQAQPALDAHTTRLADALVAQAALSLEAAELHALAQERERMQAELGAAAQIQSQLLVSAPGVCVPGLQAAAWMQPAREVGGDFHDFVVHADGRLDVIVGDVMGKGLGPALLGAATRAELLRALLGAPTPLHQVVERAACALHPRLLALESFVTLAYLRFYPAQQRLELADNGHGHVLCAFGGGRVVPLRGDALPLGFGTPAQPPARVVQVAPGDVVLVYSDGVIDARAAGGGKERFGVARLSSALARHAACVPEAVLEALCEELHAFTGGAPAEDDRTLVLVRVVEA